MENLITMNMNFLTRDVGNGGPGGSEGPWPLTLCPTMQKCPLKILKCPFCIIIHLAKFSMSDETQRAIFVIKAFYEDDCQHCLH